MSRRVSVCVGVLVFVSVGDVCVEVSVSVCLDVRLWLRLTLAPRCAPREGGNGDVGMPGVHGSVSVRPWTSYVCPHRDDSSDLPTLIPPPRAARLFAMSGLGRGLWGVGDGGRWCRTLKRPAAANEVQL